TAFRRNLLADEETWIVVDDRAALRGLPDAFIDALAMAAEERGLKGRWAIVNTRSSVDPVLTYADDRELRRRVWTAFVMRGDNGDAHDNKALIAEILKLRHERAGLLGHPTHAHMRLHNTMAQTPERAMTLLEQVWRPAVARVHEEVRDMQALADSQGAGIKIAPWDYRYYQEKVRKARYDLDEGEVKAYLQLDKLREAMFWAAGRNFGWTIVAADLPVYHPDVTAWQVKDAQGRHIGYFYFDPFARSGKRSGAWMNQIRSQERFAGAVTPVVSNNENCVKPAPGRSALLSWDDATTLFHECGHGMHRLASDVVSPAVSGADVGVVAVGPPDPGPLRPASRDRPPDADRADGQGRARPSLQPGLRHRRVSGQRHRRHALPPGRDAAVGPGRLREGGAGRDRPAGRTGHAPSQPAVRPLLRVRQLFGGLLRLSVGRHPGGGRGRALRHGAGRFLRPRAVASLL